MVAPRAITVNVYNATKRRGLAGTVATELRKRGFRVGKVDNDPLERRVTGLAEVRNSTQGADAARTVTAQVGTVVAVPDQRKDATVDLVLGRGFPRAAAAGRSGRRAVADPAAGAGRLLTDVRSGSGRVRGSPCGERALPCDCPCPDPPR